MIAAVSCLRPASQEFTKLAESHRFKYLLIISGVRIQNARNRCTRVGTPQATVFA